MLISPPYSLQKCKKTYNIPEKCEKVWVKQPTSDAGKRFCLLNICFSSDGTRLGLPLFSEAKESKYWGLKKIPGTLT